MRNFKTLVILAAILGAISCASPQSPQNNTLLKMVLKEQAGLDFRGELKIINFESQNSIGADYFEIYDIELSAEQITEVFKIIRSSNDCNNWKMIERGYALLTKPSINLTTSVITYYTFTLDTTSNILEIQFAQE